MDFTIQFPDPRLADDEGLIAVGGELKPEYLINAYANGIFPWFNEGDPILWWSPNPRMILYPDEFKLSKSLNKTIKGGRFEIKIDQNFSEVIKNCAAKNRPDQDGTWITQSMINAYIDLYKMGLAHSFESYIDNKLVGGLYGVSLGKAFFGESMFFTEKDASKVAFYYLVQFCLSNKFHFIDAQQPTNHLRSLGAEEVHRDFFLEKLENALKHQTLRIKWSM